MSPDRRTWRHYASIARPDHWVKHIFILPGIVVGIALAPTFPVTDILFNCVVGFVSACLIASANYVINEWLDAESDRNHPEKSARPSAKGLVQAKYVYLEYAVLAVLGLALAYMVNTAFLLVTLAFLISGITYNVEPFRTKNRVYLDVIFEAINNPIRLIMGWTMVSNHTVPPISLIVSFWAGGAFLMAAKRLSEYRFITKERDKATSGLYRRTFSHYSVESLTIACFVYALTSAFGTAVFLIKYRTEFVFVFPIIVILFAYYLHLSFQPDSIAQKPEHLHRDWRLMLIITVLIVAVAVLAFADLPVVERIIQSRFQELRLD